MYEESQEFGNSKLGFLVYFINRHRAVDLHDFSKLLIVLDNWHGLLFVSVKALLDTLGIVILPSTSFASFKQALLHDLFSGRKEKDRRCDCNVMLKHLSLVHLSRESIDEEATMTVRPTVPRSVLRKSSFHSVLEKLDGDFHGDYSTFLDTSLDELTMFGAFTMLLRTQEVSSRKVAKAEVVNEASTLCAFACARTAKNKYNGHFRIKSGFMGGQMESPSNLVDDSRHFSCSGEGEKAVQGDDLAGGEAEKLDSSFHDI